MNEEQAALLLKRYRLGLCNETELEALTTWFHALQSTGDWQWQYADRQSFGSELRARVFKGMSDEVQEVSGAAPIHQYGSVYRGHSVHRVHFIKNTWFRYAAILLLLAGTATYLYTSTSFPSFRRNPEVSKNQQLTKPQDILPGGNKAILTLADGSTIILDSAVNGTLAQQGGIAVVKLDAGKLAYEGTHATGDITYNKVSTPKGGQYQVTLPDGSQVWLNAASSIRFPTAFGKERNVSITGEVYFEIAHDKSRPFTVTAPGARVEVLGTGFNINAYQDEKNAKISLLEGRIKIDNTILEPGEAFQRGAVVPTDVAQDVAWKNGVFNFNKVTLEQAMHQLAKWYDIEIVYEKGIPNITFGGKMGRNLTLGEVLTSLEGMGVHFRLEEGRRLIVTP